MDESPTLAQEPAVDLTRQVQDRRGRRRASIWPPMAFAAPGPVEEAHAEPAGRPAYPSAAPRHLLVADADSRESGRHA